MHRSGVTIIRVLGIVALAVLGACTAETKTTPTGLTDTEPAEAQHAATKADTDSANANTQTSATAHVGLDGDVKRPPADEAAIATLPPETSDDLALASLPSKPEKATIPDIAPHELLGLDRAKLEDLLGRPELRRREPPAELWQYRTTTCVFDLVLYTKSDTNNLSHVTFFEARDRDAKHADATDCLNALLHQPAG